MKPRSDVRVSQGPFAGVAAAIDSHLEIQASLRVFFIQFVFRNIVLNLQSITLLSKEHLPLTGQILLLVDELFHPK